MNKKLFIGLGNPGPQYDHTRHNLGLDALRAFVNDDATWQENSKVNAMIALVTNYQLTSTCFFPLTGMNDSGIAVAAFLKNNPVALQDIIIIHDELELPLGQVKLVQGGSAKGHNGVRSIQESVGSSEIPRLKLGIGREAGGQDVSTFVLKRFLPTEQEVVNKMIKQATTQLASIIS